MHNTAIVSGRTLYFIICDISIMLKYKFISFLSWHKNKHDCKNDINNWNYTSVYNIQWKNYASEEIFRKVSVQKHKYHIKHLFTLNIFCTMYLITKSLLSKQENHSETQYVFRALQSIVTQYFALNKTIYFRNYTLALLLSKFAVTFL